MASAFRELLSERLVENRPHLSSSSLKTYISILFNLHKHLQQDHSDLSWFNTSIDEIINYLKDKPSQSRKSTLAALFVLTNNPKFRELMIDDCKVVNENYKNQKKSTKEKENWISKDLIKNKYDDLYTTVKKMFSKTAVADTSVIVEYLLIALLGGVLPSFAPRRSLDYALMKIRNYDVKKDNYYKAGKLYFHTYKTSNVYGLQVISVPDELNKIIKKWIKINDTDYLLFSTNRNPLSSSQITRLLNKIFDGKKVSVDLLRHIYLTDYYKNIPALRDMEALARDMGHSVSTAMTYIKKE